jgi:multidrug efflux system membrane fusion protein
MLLSVPLLAAMATGCQQAQSGPVRATPVAVYDPPVTRTVTDFEEFPGETEAPYSVQIRARVSGYMTNVYFLDGTMVKKGDKLFEIDPRMYRADLERARGTVAQYEAHVDRLKKEHARAKNLIARGSISQEEYDRYEADLREADANLRVAVGNRDLAALNLEWTEVRAPIDGLLSRRMVDPGNLIKADDTQLTSVVSLDPLYVYFDVHEQAMLRIKRLMQQGKLKLQAQGQKAVPVQIGLSDETDFPHRGIVDFTDNRVDVNTGTLRFRAKIDNPADAQGNRFIVPGLFVRVRLPIGEPHPALMVREQALVSDQGRKTVYVIKEKKDEKGQPVKDEKGQPVHVAMVRDVGTIGVLEDGYREVEKGIEPGDRVVIAGMQRLRPGIEVKPEKYDAAAVRKKAVDQKKSEAIGGSAGESAGHGPAEGGAGAKASADPAAKVEADHSSSTTSSPVPARTETALPARSEGADDSWDRRPPAPVTKGSAVRSQDGARRGRTGH